MLYTILGSGSFSMTEVLIDLLASILVVMLILPLHELAHGFVAYKLGDNTAKNQGRLTLNPMAHLDIMGAMCLLLVGFGWATPVPVNPRNFKHPKRDMALVALAGPVSNLLAALVGAILQNFLIYFVSSSSMQNSFAYFANVFLLYYVSVNIGLAVFNLIPLPPLDGSKILGAFLSDKTYYKMMLNERTLSMVLLLLVVLNVVDKIVYLPRMILSVAIYALATLPFLPFL